MPPARSTRSTNNNSANIGFEQKLWLAADKLRSNMDAVEYKHVVLGLVFLKYISDSFEEHHANLIAGECEYAGANTEDPDEYPAENVFWVPPAARWRYVQNSAKQPTIGKIVDDAIVAIERDNPRLKGILPKDYARPPRRVSCGLLVEMLAPYKGRIYIPAAASEACSCNRKNSSNPTAVGSTTSTSTARRATPTRPPRHDERRHPRHNGGMSSALATSE